MATLATANTPRGTILKNIKSNHVSKFINLVWDDAETVSKESGLPMGLLISMAALESGWGRSKVCKEKNNYLGIKYKGQYRTFKSRLECFRKWSKVLCQSCYKEIPADSINLWLYALDYCGYHQSDTYDNKIRSIYYKYKLNECDNF